MLLGLLAPAAPAADLPRNGLDFTIHMPGGKELPLSQYKGHPIILAFILTSCPHCQHAVQILSQLQTEYGPRGLQVLASAVEQDSQSHVNLFIRNFAPKFPVGYNSGAEAGRFLPTTGKVPLMPVLGFIDRQGVLRAQHEGEEPFFNDLEQSLRHEIAVLLAGKK